MLRVALLAGLVVSCGGSSTQAQESSADLRRQVEELKRSQAATQEELTELKLILAPLLEKLPKPFRPRDVSISGSPTLGGDSTVVTIVEFSDLQCPYCVRFHENTFPLILKDYVKTGKVRYVAREFPLTTIHKQAQRASQAALCAGEQGKYWELREKIFQNRKNLSDPELASYAEAVGVEIAPWQACLASDTYSKRVEADMKAGAELGIRGTPAFAIGLTDPKNPGKFRASKLLEGAYPYQAFQQAIDELLSTAANID